MLLKTAIKATLQAGKEILDVYNNRDFNVEMKSDDSPLTEADKRANDVIVGILQETGIPVISEENKLLAYSERAAWSQCWLVDPLDGTKEFIKRNGEFTVNIALIEDGCPVLGVIYVPVTQELYYGIVSEQKAWKAIVDNIDAAVEEIMAQAIALVPAAINKAHIRVVGSRSHMSDETMAFIKELEKDFANVEMVSKGSSLKFCLVAEGKADVYPRFAPTMEWDTAAGQAICEAAGLKVLIRDSDQRLHYNKENLLNPFFLVKN